MRQLILASSSPYRKSLLERLNLPFDCIAADIDESPSDEEGAENLALRLATEKAHEVAADHPIAIVIGSDQVAELELIAGSQDNPLLGKPGNHQRAIEQLTAQSGRTVNFYTAVAVVDHNTLTTTVDVTKVQFRHLQQEEIEHYLKVDTPYNCAGSFKAESLGITLFESVISNDPTSLIGLPLIKLSQILRDKNIKAR